MSRTVGIDVFCDIEQGEKNTFGVAKEHRPDLPKPFDAPLQEWVEDTFGDELEAGESLMDAAEMKYEPEGEIIEFRRKE